MKDELIADYGDSGWHFEIMFSADVYAAETEVAAGRFCRRRTQDFDQAFIGHMTVEIHKHDEALSKSAFFLLMSSFYFYYFWCDFGAQRCRTQTDYQMSFRRCLSFALPAPPLSLLVLLKHFPCFSINS